MKLSVAVVAIFYFGRALADTTTTESVSMDTTSVAQAERDARRQKLRGLQGSSDGGDNGADGVGCFSEHDYAEVMGRGPVSMNELRIGDWVRASNGQFSRIYSFSHMDPHAEVNFIQLYAESNPNKPIELTAEHMVFANQVAVPAAQVKIGDVLLVSENPSPVIKIESVKRRGVYAPVTVTGDILVNDVMASCYVAMLNPVTTVMNQHSIAHATMTVHRMICGLSPSTCDEESYIDGRSAFAMPLIRFARALKEQYVLIQFIVLLVTVPMIFFAYGLEQSFMMMNNSPAFLILALIGLAYKYRSNKNVNGKIKVV